MKVKYAIILSLLVVTSLLLSACTIPIVRSIQGSGVLTSEKREVSNFDAIQLDGAGQLVITQGDSYALEIEAEANVLPELTSEVRASTLVLGWTEHFWRHTVLPTREITYTLTVPDLNAIAFNGAGGLFMDSFESDTLDIEINGAGKVQLTNLSVDSLSVQIAGSGNIDLSGEVARQWLIVDGAGNIDAGNLKSAVAEIEVNGLGNAKIWVTESLNVTINGGGSLSYYGNPTVMQDISGVGSINHLGEK